MTPITEMEAVNDILANVQEAAIEGWDDDSAVITGARNRLARVSTEVQTKGWWFNEEDNFVITPDVNGWIVLPTNTLKADSSGLSADMDLVQRGNRLYDKTNQTYAIGKPVSVALTLGMAFEELPSTARQYITIRAARKFADTMFGEQHIHAYSKQDEQEAYQAMNTEDIENRDANFIGDSSFLWRMNRHR